MSYTVGMAGSSVTLRLPSDRVSLWKRLAADRGLSVSQLIRSQMELVEQDFAAAPMGSVSEVGSTPADGGRAGSASSRIVSLRAVVDAAPLPRRPRHHVRCECAICRGVVVAESVPTTGVRAPRHLPRCNCPSCSGAVVAVPQPASVPRRSGHHPRCDCPACSGVPVAESKPASGSSATRRHHPRCTCPTCSAGRVDG